MLGDRTRRRQGKGGELRERRRGEEEDRGRVVV